VEKLTMKNTYILLAGLALYVAGQTAVSAGDTNCGHVSLPKGKYVMTNTESGGSFVVHVDDKGNMTGPAQGAAAAPEKKDAPAPAVAPVQSSKSVMMDKLKSGAGQAAAKAVTSDKVQGLMRKVGADKYLK
jgi:hypothetical protein